MERSFENGNRLSVLIVDDEETSRRSIWRLLENDADVMHVAEAVDGPSAVEAIRDTVPDLVFMDVQMPGFDGFEVLARIELRPLPAVIFVTAYDEYALSAFDAHAVDYLLKPFSDGRFAESLEQAKSHIRAREAAEFNQRLIGLLTFHTGCAGSGSVHPMYLREIVVKSPERVKLIDVGTVDWIEARGDYLVYHAGGQQYMVRGTMTNIEMRLDPCRFFRIHRSVIVNLKRVKELQPYFHGDYAVILHDGSELRLSRRRREKLSALLGQPI